MNEESYKCRPCGSETKLGDFYYYESCIYQAMKKYGLRRRCLLNHRICFRRMDVYDYQPCYHCTEEEQNECFKKSYGDMIDDKPPR